MSNKTTGPVIGKSAFEEEGAETAIELFIRQTTKACQEHGEPLPNIVKNYKPGDTVLYKRPNYEQQDFDMVNNNGD